jgi:hypothetical protein
VNEAAAHIAPALRIVATDDYDVSRHSKVAQDAMETHRLLSLIRDLGLYDEKANAAVRILRPKSARAKQNDLRVGYGGSQAAPCLGDQNLIGCTHGRIINLAADNSYHESVAHKQIKETMRKTPAAQIVTATTPHLAALVVEGTVRPSEGSRHLPKPTRLLGAGRNAASYVTEGRR